MTSARSVRAGGAFVELFARDAELHRAFRRASRTVSRFGTSVGRVGAGITAVSTAAFGGLSAAAISFAKFGDAVQKSADRTGFATESISELKFAAEQSGASIEVVEKAIRRSQKVILDASRGLTSAARPFDELGLSVDRLRALDPEGQFLAIAQALGELGDASRRSALSQDLFGRAGSQLAPLIDGGAGELAALRQQARDLGLVLDRETADSAAALTDALNELRSSTRALVLQVGAALAPSLTDLSGSIAASVAGFSEFVRENRELVVAASAGAAGLAVLGGGVTALGIGFIGLASAISLAGGALALVASPAALAVAGVAGLALGLVAVTDAADDFAEAGRGIARAFEDGIGGALDALRSGDLELAAQIAAGSIKTAFLEAFDSAFAPLRNARSAIAGAANAASAVESLPGQSSSPARGLAGFFAGAVSRASSGFLEAQRSALGPIVDLDFGGLADASRAATDALRAEAAQRDEASRTVVEAARASSSVFTDFMGRIFEAAREEVAQVRELRTRFALAPASFFASPVEQERDELRRASLGFSTLVATGFGVRGSFARFNASQSIEERTARAAERTADGMAEVLAGLRSGAYGLLMV